jgi:flagellar hook-basal body complex protein FliE
LTPERARGDTMAIEGVSALGAVGTQLEMGASRGTTGAASASASGASFTQTLAQVVDDAVGSMQSGEAAAIQGLQGNMQPFKVVEAIMGAQRTLQQTLAIRDKAVSAYQEISRMAI